MDNPLDNMHFMVLNIGRKRCGTDWNYRNVCSPFTRIYYITSGEACIALPDGELRLEAGRMYIVPAFTRHDCSCDREFEHFYLHLYNEAGTYLTEDWELPRQIEPHSGDRALIERLLGLCSGMELVETDPRRYDNSHQLSRSVERNKRRDLWVRVESRGIIYLILSRFMEHAVPRTHVSDLRLHTVLSHIRSNLTKEICLDELARMVHLSKDHLIRLFKKEMNTTPRMYINARLIELAQLKLITEPLSIKEIAYSLGFDDVAYFNRLFKKHTSLTPMAYRRTVPGPEAEAQAIGSQFLPRNIRLSQM